MQKTSSPIKRGRTDLGQGEIDFDHRALVIDNEHLRNTLIGLNEKLTVFNDLKNDLEQHQSMFEDSEVHREELQVHIKTTSVHIQSDSSQNKSYQDTLISENN